MPTDVGNICLSAHLNASQCALNETRGVCLRDAAIKCVPDSVKGLYRQAARTHMAAGGSQRGPEAGDTLDPKNKAVRGAERRGRERTVQAWRGDQISGPTPSTRCCPCGSCARCGEHAAERRCPCDCNLTHWLISTQYKQQKAGGGTLTRPRSSRINRVRCLLLLRDYLI